MSTCVISPEASQDLDKIFDYFAGRSVEAGERFVVAFEQKCQTLIKYPLIGRSYTEIDPSLRGMALDGYIIFYRPIEQGIEIIRVVSGYRNLESLFSEFSYYLNPSMAKSLETDRIQKSRILSNY